MQLCQTTKWYSRHLMLNAIPSDDLCSGPAVHGDGQRVPRPPRIQDRRENPARSLHQVRFGVFRQNTCDYSGVYIRLDLNCVLRQNTNNDYSGTWSERTCRWCLPRRTGTCWAAPWSTSPGPALSPAWGSPAGPFRPFHFWVLLFTFANFQVHSAGTWSPWSSSLSSWISPSPSSSASCPGSTLETPMGRWSTRTGRPALCLPSLRLRLFIVVLFHHRLCCHRYLCLRCHHLSFIALSQSSPLSWSTFHIPKNVRVGSTLRCPSMVDLTTGKECSMLVSRPKLAKFLFCEIFYLVQFFYRDPLHKPSPRLVWEGGPLPHGGVAPLSYIWYFPHGGPHILLFDIWRSLPHGCHHFFLTFDPLFDIWENTFESKYLRAAQIKNEIYFSSPSLLSPARAWGIEPDVGSLQLDHEIGNIVFVVFLIVFLTGIPSIWPSSSLHFNHELGIVILISHCAIFIKTFQQDAKVDISLWGYRETSIEPELVSSQSLFFLILGIIFQRGIDVSIICWIFLNLS